MPDFDNSDKAVHFVCFGALSVCFGLWFSLQEWKKSPAKYAALATLFTSIYGAIDEVHQSFVPGRFAGAGDWTADTIGAAIGAIFCIFVTRRKNK